jgi:hypothetical protein
MFSDELGALVTSGSIGDLLQHEGRLGMVMGFSEEGHGGSSPVLTEMMAAVATTT